MLPRRAGARSSLDALAGRGHLVAMANPFDREIEAALHRGREPESWKRRGTKRENVVEQPEVAIQGPVGESAKPPKGTGMNGPGRQQ